MNINMKIEVQSGAICNINALPTPVILAKNPLISEKSETPAQPSEEESREEFSLAHVTVHKDTDGTIDGVRVKTFDEDFVIAKDYLRKEDGEVEYMNWNDMTERVNKGEFKTFTRKQGAIICAYWDEINSLLDEIDVVNLTEESFWCLGEYNAYNGWIVYGTYGCLNRTNKLYSHAVRLAIAL